MDKNLENIINRVANRNSISNLKVKMAVETFFKTQKQLMQRKDMPIVMIHNWGRYIPCEKKIKKKLVLLTKHLKNGKITQEEFESQKEELTLVLDKLKRNEHKRNF
jgi:uncharacterized protein (DUF4213/DUF364 family)